MNAVDPHDRARLASKRASPRGLLCVPDLGAYLQAVAAWIDTGSAADVPVLTTSPGPPPGLGGIATTQWRGLRTAPEEASAALRAFLDARPPSDPHQQICLAPNDPLCLAAAALLSEGGSRQFARLPEGRPTAGHILDLIARRRPRSLTFVTPLLGGRPGAPGRAYLSALIEALRAAEEDCVLPPYGVVTGVDAAALSQLAAKALLHQAVAAQYRDGLHFVDDMGSAPPDRPPSDGVGRDPSSPRGLSHLHLSALPRDQVADFAAAPHNVLVVKAHGRSYCAGRGLLCGARRIDADPGQPAETCITNFACAWPDVHRSDPRRLHARILLLDACDSIDLTSDAWTEGHAAVGFLSGAGFPSAVVAADGLVVPLGANGFELLASILGCSTVGAWCRQLNGAVRGPNPPSSFILFGDPDLPLHVDQTPWVADAQVEPTCGDGERAWRVTAPAGQVALFRARLAGGRPPADDALYVWAETEGCQVSGAAWDADGAASDLWFALRARTDVEAVVRVEQRPPTTPPWVGIQAVRRALTEAPEFINPVVAEAWEVLRAVGHHLVEVVSAPGVQSGRTRLQDPQDILRAEGRARALWDTTQAACLSKVAEQVVPATNVYLPTLLWRVENHTLRREARACPQCGASPLFVRDYRAGPLHWRSSFDCPNCCFILEDRPRDEPAILTEVVAPERAAPGDRVPVGVRVSNPHRDRGLSGALQISVSLATHGLKAEDPVLRFQLEPGTTDILGTHLVPSGAPALPHDYAVRVVALVEGAWHWRARRLVLTGTPLEYERPTAPP